MPGRLKTKTQPSLRHNQLDIDLKAGLLFCVYRLKDGSISLQKLKSFFFYHCSSISTKIHMSECVEEGTVMQFSKFLSSIKSY